MAVGQGYPVPGGGRGQMRAADADRDRAVSFLSHRLHRGPAGQGRVRRPPGDRPVRAHLRRAGPGRDRPAGRAGRPGAAAGPQLRPTGWRSPAWPAGWRSSRSGHCRPSRPSCSATWPGTRSSAPGSRAPGWHWRACCWAGRRSSWASLPSWASRCSSLRTPATRPSRTPHALPRQLQAAAAAAGAARPDQRCLSGWVDSAAMKASCGTSTRPITFIRRLPSFCFSSSLRLRVMSPP